MSRGKQDIGRSCLLMLPARHKRQCGVLVRWQLMTPYTTGTSYALDRQRVTRAELEAGFSGTHPYMLFKLFSHSAGRTSAVAKTFTRRTTAWWEVVDIIAADATAEARRYEPR